MNLKKIFHLYQKLAENDDDDAMVYLATSYLKGEGTEKNSGKAFYWYRKAA